MIWKRTRQSHRQRQDQKQREIKQADLDMVELSAAVGEIDLFYLDESGFCMWTPVSAGCKAAKSRLATLESSAFCATFSKEDKKDSNRLKEEEDV